MKCTLRKVNEGVVATKTLDTIKLNEPIQEGRKYIVLQHNKGGVKVPYLLPDTKLNPLERANLVSDIYEVIASTFGFAKELYVEYFGWAGLDRMRIDRFIEVWEREEKKYIDFTKPYEYTETDNQVIIKL